MIYTSYRVLPRNRWISPNNKLFNINADKWQQEGQGAKWKLGFGFGFGATLEVQGSKLESIDWGPVYNTFNTFWNGLIGNQKFVTLAVRGGSRLYS